MMMNPEKPKQKTNRKKNSRGYYKRRNELYKRGTIRKTPSTKTNKKDYTGTNLLTQQTSSQRPQTSITTRSFPKLPDTLFWPVGSCIRELLPKGGSKGPCLGEVPYHNINK